MTQDIIPSSKFGTTTAIEAEDDLPRIGQFYWVREVETWDRRGRKKGDVYEWLGCVMKVGSNFVEIHSPKFDSGYSTTRVHIDDFDRDLRFEPNHETIIAQKIAYHQSTVTSLLGEIKKVTNRLGVIPQTQIANPLSEGSNSLAVVSSQVDTGAYKTALIAAKEKTLPDLFRQVEEANKMLAGWMTAPSLPMMAQIAPMKDSIKAIDDRVYTLELYAGLTEEAIKCRDGDPARREEKLHVMQRRLYMDEECLLNYEAGGMEFRDIREFDSWISRTENRDRILPFPRTLVAFRVRRSAKEREDEGNVLNMFVNFQLKEKDEWTFVYVRNGDQVWRINAQFEFDEMIFPDQDIFDPSEPMMMKSGGYGDRVDKLMSVREYESLCETRANHDAWMKENKGKPKLDDAGVVIPNRFFYEGDSPYYRQASGFRASEWSPVNDTNVYFDEANEKLSKEVKRWNRASIIIQGLFDRSLVLHPHPPVQTWTPSGFETAVKLVYDASTLTHGDKPDFDAYRTRLNTTITADSIVTGQEDFWLRAMADRENERQERDWRRGERQRSNYTRYRPYENPGPGFVSRMTDWKSRSRKAFFRWEMRVEDYWNRRAGATKPKTIDVPVTELLNVSAYRPGDYLQFFADPRSRAEYLRWAPLMLAAEDYHAGKLTLNTSSENKKELYRDRESGRS